MNPLVNLSDEALTDLLRSGDQAAFNEIFLRYWDGMFVFARKLLDDPSDAEDIVQEILSYVWAKKEDLSITSSLRSYLFQSVKYKVLNLIQRKKLVTRYQQSLQDFMDRGEYTTDESIREKELIQVIEKAIAGLPPKMKTIFELSRSEHLSHKNIGDKLGLSDQTVKKQIQNALKILRLKLRILFLVIFH